MPCISNVGLPSGQGGKSGPLFQWQDGTPLTKSKFVESVRAALTRVGLPASDFAGHSFRIDHLHASETILIKSLIAVTS